MPSLTKTFLRCHSTVCVLMNSCAPISWFVSPSAASRAICRLLGGQLVAGTDRLFAHLLTDGHQFAASPLREGVGAHPGEHRVRVVEVSTRIEAPVQPAQPFPVAQMSPSQMHDDAGALQAFDGFGEEVFGLLDRRPAGHAHPPKRPDPSRFRWRPRVPRAAVCAAAAACLLARVHRSFDQFDQAPPVEAEILVLTRLASGSERLVVSAESVVEHGA